MTKFAGLLRRTLFIALLVTLVLTGCGDDDDDNDSKTSDDDADDDDADDDAADDDSEETVPDCFLNPGEPGPYMVGSTTFYFEDTSRALSCGEGNRILMTEIWYPSVDNADEWPENFITDYFLGRNDEIAAAFEELGEDIEGQMIDIATGSYRDAPLHPDAPPMPILIFSHGFSANRFQSFTQANYLASHGYVVVSPDHICNSKITLTPDDVVIGGSILGAVTSLSERKGDVSFLIDVMLDDPPAMFAGRLDGSRIGLFGHSFGGMTVSEQVKVEHRVSALVQFASFGFPAGVENVYAPSMYFWGRQDIWMYLFESFHDNYIDMMPQPTVEMEFDDTGHFAFSDLCEYLSDLKESGNGCGTGTRIGSNEEFTNPDRDAMHSVINPYMAAFFGWAFFDVPELESYILENHAPDMMDMNIVHD